MLEQCFQALTVAFGSVGVARGRAVVASETLLNAGVPVRFQISVGYRC